MNERQPQRWSILVTVDYELFGDGTGSIEEHMIQPLDDLLGVWNRLGIKGTVFVEAAEIMAFERAVSQGEGPGQLQRRLLEIKTQLMRAIELGHDLQLHLHPQWRRARWLEGRWQFERHHYSLLQYGRQTLTELLFQGKKYLEALAGEVDPGYKCRAFRAGAFHFDRDRAVGKALLEAGLRLDSSVCRGYTRDTAQAHIDYSDTLGLTQPFWPTLDGAPLHSGGETLWEVPIWTVMRAQAWKITPKRVINKLASILGGSNPSSQVAQTGLSFKDPSGLFKWLRQRQPILWDFCNLSSRALANQFRQAQRFHQPGEFNPLVMIGHTKEYRSGKSLERFVKSSLHRSEIEWLTMNSLIDRLDAGQV